MSPIMGINTCFFFCCFFFFFFFCCCCFFTVKYWLQQTLFLLLRRGTTYLSENGPHHEKTCFCPMWTTKAQISLRIHAVWSAPLLFAAWIVMRFYSSKLYSSIGTYTVSPTCQFAESVLSLHIHLFKSKYHPAGTVLLRFCFHVSIFVIHLFDKK